MKQSHDIGGEPDAQGIFEEKEEEQWELNTFVDCEVLGWRGIWTSEERRRIGNVDIGRTMYHGLPYYGRWLWAIVRILMEKQHITLGELIERVHSVQERATGRTTQNPLEAEPRSTGNEKTVVRNRHHKDAVGKGDPQCFKGMAGKARFLSVTRFEYASTDHPLLTHPGVLRGAPGTITRVRTRASLRRTRHSFAKTRSPNGSTSCASRWLISGSRTPALRRTHSSQRLWSGGLSHAQLRRVVTDDKESTDGRGNHGLRGSRDRAP